MIYCRSDVIQRSLSSRKHGSFSCGGQLACNPDIFAQVVCVSESSMGINKTNSLRRWNTVVGKAEGGEFSSVACAARCISFSMNITSNAIQC